MGPAGTHGEAEAAAEAARGWVGARGEGEGGSLQVGGTAAARQPTCRSLPTVCRLNRSCLPCPVPPRLTPSLLPPLLQRGTHGGQRWDTTPRWVPTGAPTSAARRRGTRPTPTTGSGPTRWGTSVGCGGGACAGARSPCLPGGTNARCSTAACSKLQRWTPQAILPAPRPPPPPPLAQEIWDLITMNGTNADPRDVAVFVRDPKEIVGRWRGGGGGGWCGRGRSLPACLPCMLHATWVDATRGAPCLPGEPAKPLPPLALPPHCRSPAVQTRRRRGVATAWSRRWVGWAARG